MASHIGRRKFLDTLLSGAAAWPVAARAQQPERMRLIGTLMPYAANDPQAQARNAAFLQRLQRWRQADVARTFNLSQATISRLQG
jgi:hypothetical protein